VLGPDDGRYLLREHAGEPAHVLVIKTLGAPQRRLLGGGKRPRDAAPEPEPTPVATSRVTLIGAQPFGDAAAAGAWLRAADLETEAAAALGVLNRVLHAQRVVSADPYLREVSREQALVARVGLGAGDEVADGRWTDARELVTVRRGSITRKASALRPQERLSALLAGRDAALACEELTLRARLDLASGRQREAALQLRVALEAALAELVPWSDRDEVAKRLAALGEERDTVGAAANAALEGGLDAETAAEVERVVGRIEAALRARTAVGFD
jgi:hypothetical protein